MKRVVLSVLLALSAAVPVAQAAPVQLVVRSPDLTNAVGTQADGAATGALDAGFNAAGGITLTEFVWWGYHLAGSSAEQFEITLNGTLVGSQSMALGGISRLDTGNDLTDPNQPAVASVDLIRYTLQFEPGVVSASGANTVSIVNDDPGAEWFWQGTAGSLTNAQSAFTLTGDVTQQVPEPAGLVLVLAALAAAALVRRRA